MKAEENLILQNINEKIESFWNLIVEGLDDRNSVLVQNSSFTLSNNLRSLGILKFRLDGDRLATFESCSVSATIYTQVNKLIRSGMPFDEELYNLSNNRCFFDTLFSLGSEETKKIIKYMPVDESNADDYIKYNFVRALIELMLGLTEECSQTISILDELSSVGKDAKINALVCDALLSKNGSKFNDSMDEFLSFREEQISNNDGVLAGEEYLSIEALGLIRLAKELGIEFKKEHILAPTILTNNYPDYKQFKNKFVLNIAESAFSKNYWM